MAATIVIILALVVSVSLNVLQLTRKKINNNNHSVRTTILSGIQNVSELATIRERFQSIIMFSEASKIPFFNRFNIPGTRRKFILKYSGTIVCGCDLSKAQVTERRDSKSVRVTLPHSEILDIYADVHSFEVYDQSAGIFTAVRLEDQNREINNDLEKIKAHEIERGILAHSDENVRRVLTSVVASTGMTPEITFTENNFQALPEKETLSLS
ncbi:MAG: DUF4230 domain-containing protein [Synergistaceae bacterium]|nr:DUF4230 domain-containing protein [Synergistaceae bacterium]